MHLSQQIVRANLKFEVSVRVATAQKRPSASAAFHHHETRGAVTPELSERGYNIRQSKAFLRLISGLVLIAGWYVVLFQLKATAENSHDLC